MAGLFRFLHGYLRIRISGFSRERFLNLCAGKRIFLWNVSFRENAFESWISVRDFRELNPIVRKTKVKVAVLKKCGLPFLLPRIQRQWSFVLGALLAVTLWFASSFFVWEIRCNGNLQITEDQLLQFLAQQGIRIGKPIGSIDIADIEKKLRSSFPVIVWTSVKQDGTGLMIEVKENELEQTETARLQEEPAQKGSNLISDYDGVVVSRIVREGVPKVKIGDVVEKGQVLVEAYLPIFAEDGSVRGKIATRADADIYIKHLIHWEDEVPCYYEEKVYSGREKKAYYLKMGEKNLLFRRGKSYLSETDVVTQNRPHLFEILDLPVYFGRITHQEYFLWEKKHSSEEMENLISEKITLFSETLTEKGVQIIEKNVKIENKGVSYHLSGEFMVIERANVFQETEEEIDTGSRKDGSGGRPDNTGDRCGISAAPFWRWGCLSSEDRKGISCHGCRPGWEGHYLGTG